MKHKELQVRFQGIVLQQKKACIRCGYSQYPQILHFHHRDPSGKSFDVSTFARRAKAGTESELWAEIAKCDVLCPNCHALAHDDSEAGLDSSHLKCHLHLAMDDNCFNCRRLVKKRFNRRNRERMIAFFGGSCLGCQDSYTRSEYDFHHVVPEDKQYWISQLSVSLQYRKLASELTKCVMLCKNCHRLVHANLIFLPESIHYHNKEDLYYAITGKDYNASDAKITAPKQCVVCNKNISYTATRCRKCDHKHKRETSPGSVIEWPSNEKLIAMLAASNYSAVGRQLGVSDNAVRKRLKLRNLI